MTGAKRLAPLVNVFLTVVIVAVSSDRQRTFLELQHEREKVRAKISALRVRLEASLDAHFKAVRGVAPPCRQSPTCRMSVSSTPG